jgi:hypothetical protein
LSNFSVNYLKDTWSNVENKLHHGSTNVLKFSKHPNFFSAHFLKKWHQGIFQHQISCNTALLGLKNPLMPIFVGKEPKQKLGVF